MNDSMVLWSHLSRRVEAPDVSGVIDRLMSRTLLTSASTAVPALAILAVGLEPLAGFAWAVLLGTAAGTLSSIFVVGSFADRPVGATAREEPRNAVAAEARVG